MTDWFHGSPHRLEAGEVLRSGLKKTNFSQSDETAVSVTSEPDVALMWARKADESAVQVYVYLVQPETAPEVWRSMPKNFGKDVAVLEARTSSATILEIVFGDKNLNLPTDAGKYVRDGRGKILQIM